MKTSRWLLPITLSALFCSQRAWAQEKHEHAASELEKFGKVEFPVSCSAAAQEKFHRAVALLHSFAYEEAEKAFVDVLATDLSCAMGHWGIAMSLYHPVWAAANPSAAPTPAELKRGWEAVQKAKTTGSPTPREKDYISAIEDFYKDADRLDHSTRAVAFEKAMERLQQRHPEDKEAAIFYALALLGTAPPTDKTYAKQKKAAEFLNRVLPETPEHPGVAHYLIHSFDYPQLAQVALPAARAYSKIAPSAPHALHMPSHIFTRLGFWDESIESNIASAAAARRLVAKTHPGATAFDELHALDYLEYAYLQTGRDGEARRVLEQLTAVKKLDLPNFAAAYALAAVPARYSLERRSWKEAAALTVPLASFPWSRFPYAEAIVHFARGVGGARGGELAVAGEAIERLSSIQKGLAEKGDVYWAEQVEIQRRAAAAWLAHAKGKREEAVSLLRSAADMEDASEKHPVTPGPVLPARELLGDLLIELQSPGQALKEFETSLATAPGRFNGLHGAARAAELSGNHEKARHYCAELVALCRSADTERPELKEAKAFLAKQTSSR